MEGIMKTTGVLFALALLAACDPPARNPGGGDGAGRAAPAYAGDAVAFDGEGQLGTASNPFDVDGEWPFASAAHRAELGRFGAELGAFVDPIEIDGTTWFAWLPARDLGPDETGSGTIPW